MTWHPTYDEALQILHDGFPIDPDDLRAIAADIWDEGYEYGRGDGECTSYTRPEDRPYRASETA